MLEHLGSEGHQKFLSKTRLPQRLVEAEPKDKHAELAENSRNLKKQYRPYLYELAHTLHQIGEASETFKQQLDAVAGWADYDKQVQEERRKLEAMSGVDTIKTDDEPTVFQPRSALGLPPLSDNENNAYEQGRDADDEDLSLSDDIDMDSTNDADDYDVDHAEYLLSKQEIEAFA